MIYCVSDCRYYIGSSKKIYIRWGKHKYLLRHNKHPNPSLQNAWNKYGEDQFEFFLIESTDELTDREQYWLDYGKSYEKQYGFNIRKDSENKPGISEETRKRLRQSHLGKTLPEEQKKKIGDALRGRILSTEIKDKLSKAKKGKKFSEEHKKALSEAKKGKRSSRASISDEKAGQIKEAIKSRGNKTLHDIAKEFKVSIHIVKHMNRPSGHSWTTLQ